MERATTAEYFGPQQAVSFETPALDIGKNAGVLCSNRGHQQKR